MEKFKLSNQSINQIFFYDKITLWPICYVGKMLVAKMLVVKIIGMSITIVEIPKHEHFHFQVEKATCN